MKKKFKESKYYEDWVLKARRDLDTAFLNNRHGGYTDTTCYFCQQTVEKVLKGFLLYKGLKILPPTHNLKKLLFLCTKENKEFLELAEQTKILNQYFIETKYPADFPIDYSREETDKALEMSQEIYEFVKEKLKLE